MPSLGTLPFARYICAREASREMPPSRPEGLASLEQNTKKQLSEACMVFAGG